MITTPGLEGGCRDLLTFGALDEFQERAHRRFQAGWAPGVDDEQRADDLVFAARDVVLRRRDAVDRKHLDPLVACGARSRACDADRPAERADGRKLGLDLEHLGDVPAVGRHGPVEEVGLKRLPRSGDRLADEWTCGLVYSSFLSPVHVLVAVHPSQLVPRLAG